MNLQDRVLRCPTTHLFDAPSDAACCLLPAVVACLQAEEAAGKGKKAEGEPVWGETPLHFAVARTQIPTTRLLLARVRVQHPPWLVRLSLLGCGLGCMLCDSLFAVVLRGPTIGV